MNERKRVEIAERLLEDPGLANAQAAEIERLEQLLREHEARGAAGGPDVEADSISRSTRSR